MLIAVPSARQATPWVAVGALTTALLLYITKRTAVSKLKHGKLRKIHSLGSTGLLLGDLAEVSKHASVRHDWLAAQSLRFDFEPWQIKIPGNPVLIVLGDPACVEGVTTSQYDHFEKGATHRGILHDLLGRGLVNADGEQWFHQRKTSAKFFTARTLRAMMTHTMKKNMQQVYAVLDAQSDHGELANLTLVLNQFALQTFMEVGVGIPFPVIGDSEPHAFEKAVDTAMPLVIRRRIVPSFVWKLQRWLNIGPERELAEAVKIARDQVYEMVTTSLARTSTEKELDHTEKIKSAVELFVEHSAEDKVGLRSQDLVDFMMNFMIAARDTSSVAAQWFFYLLGKHPNVETKLRAELAAKLPRLGVGADEYITADHVKQLVYLDATIKETLRLYPAVPFMTRQAVQDTVLDGDLLIRKGQAVAISVFAMARNPHVWGPDAAEFKPERWIDPATGALIAPPTSAFLTFSAGPRNCIGMQLAMRNLRVVTANLLRRYKFEIDPRNDGSYVNAITLTMTQSVLAKVHRL